MDEVDSMSAGDRGGVGALNELIKKTKYAVWYIHFHFSAYLHRVIQIPIICIANDKGAQALQRKYF